MNTFIKVILVILLSFVVIVNCGCKNSIKSSNDEVSSLSTWVGAYTFYEFFPPNMNMSYDISIYEKDNDYFAKINIEGFQTTMHLKARVIENESGIDFILEEYLGLNFPESQRIGEVLMSFEVDGSKFKTIWRELEPLLPENKDNSNVCFEKTAND